MKAYTMVALALMASIVLVVACGGGDGKPSPTSAPGETVTAPPAATPTESTPETPGAFAQYSNPLFQVEFSYPTSWVPDPGYSTDYGNDGIFEAYKDPRGREYGFFVLNAAQSTYYDLNQVTGFDAYHKLKPFGEHPVIEPLTVDGHAARLILQDPSAPTVPNDAELVVAAPSMMGQYLLIYAHKDFIRAIAESIHVLSPATPPP
jgi:hypothetical protein